VDLLLQPLITWLLLVAVAVEVQTAVVVVRVVIALLLPQQAVAELLLLH
jgi:hypothetical protein